MRVADKMAFNQVNQNISKNRNQMADLQNQAATQKKVTKPSDDPVAAARILGNRVDLQGNKQYTKNLNYARSFLEISDQSLGEIGEALVRAKELAVAQASDAGANSTSRRITATEMEQIFNQIVQIGNRKLGDRFVFGGFKTQSNPFNGRGEYNGDSGEMLIHIDKESYVPMNVPGNKVLLGEELSGDGVVDSVLDQPRTIEEFLAKKDSAAGKKQKDMEEGAGENKLGPELRGPASIEKSSGSGNPISDEQPLKPSAGGSNVFGVLKNLEISLKTNDKEGVQDSLPMLDEAINQVILARAQVGSRSMVLDNLNESLLKSKVDSSIIISQLEDADIFETVSEMNKTENTLQATLQTSGKLVQKSLLDFIR